MASSYNKLYQTENLFGKPYPELINFFTAFTKRGKVLDLGCGQGRDAIALARLGFEVTGIDHSEVGIAQMQQIADAENLALKAVVADIFEFQDFIAFDFVLLDSMFHFAKKDHKKETELIKTIISQSKVGCVFVFCIQDTGNKVEILNQTIDFDKPLERLVDKKFRYIFEDQKTGHKSETEYRMLVCIK